MPYDLIVLAALIGLGLAMTIAASLKKSEAGEGFMDDGTKPRELQELENVIPSRRGNSKAGVAEEIVGTARDILIDQTKTLGDKSRLKRIKGINEILEVENRAIGLKQEQEEALRTSPRKTRVAELRLESEEELEVARRKTARIDELAKYADGEVRLEEAQEKLAEVRERRTNPRAQSPRRSETTEEVYDRKYREMRAVYQKEKERTATRLNPEGKPIEQLGGKDALRYKQEMGALENEEDRKLYELREKFLR